MPRLRRNKQLIENINGKNTVVKTGFKNRIIISRGYSIFNVKGNAIIETVSDNIDLETGQIKKKVTIVDAEIADLIIKYDISIGYDNTKDNKGCGYTKGYFIARYKGGKEKLHRLVYKYLYEKMSIEDIFSKKASICDGKEVHHISGLTFDNQYENLLLCETVQEHSNYQSNVSSYICINHDTNQYTIKNHFMDYIRNLSGSEDLKEELPQPNKDY